MVVVVVVAAASCLTVLFLLYLLLFQALRRTLYHRLELSLCPIITAHYSTRVAQPSTSPSILHSSSTAPEHAQYDDPTRLQQLKESPEKGDEEEGGEEKETVYQVITYVRSSSIFFLNHWSFIEW